MKNHVELVPDNVSDKDMTDEVNRRTAKAGYTTRFGEPPYRTKIMTQPSTVAYRNNYAHIFGHE